MTNREWINSLSNEQLVKLFRTFREDWCGMCADYGYDSSRDCGFCYDEQVKWLDMEHDDTAFDERDYRYCV